MGKRILIIQGHPDTSSTHLCHALEDAYVAAARAAGHEVRRVAVAHLDFPLLRSQREWEEGALPPALQQAQDDIRWAQHLVLLFPLWLGDMPALLKGFLEQVARPGFAFVRDQKHPMAQKGLAGRSARLVVTMGMPAFVYRWYFLAHGVRALERNVLRFVGMAPVRHTLIGLTGNPRAEKLLRWVGKLQHLGRAAL